jgi:cytochrome c peroxidase
MRPKLLGISAVWASMAAVLFVSSRLLPAQNGAPKAQPQQAVTPTPYNPYPPGILPSDVDSELARVQREIQGIHDQYLAQWQALGPVTYTGQPPVIQGNGYEAIRILGGLLNYDLNMSPFKNIACASCHMPYVGFGGPIPSVNLTMIAYPGSFRYRAGKRNPQR